MKEAKNLIRTEMRHNRKHYHQSIKQDEVDQALMDHVKQMAISTDKIISGYIAKGSEINITTLLMSLCAQGYRICLPVVVAKNQVLIFRQWTPDMALVLDAENVLAPGPDAPVLEPDILLIPLLAFDDQGHRLGQGMGYYDATLKSLSQKRDILAIGVAYEIQQIAQVPCQSKDYNMDMIMTDKTVRHFPLNNAPSI